MTDEILEEMLKIPESINIEVKKSALTVKGPKGSLTRVFSHPRLKIDKKDDSLSVICTTLRKRDRALHGTYVAHIKNMFTGVTQGYQYDMKIVYSHFPIKTTLKDNAVLIENFLGEHFPRKAPIYPDVKVDIQGDTITITGIDIEKISQTAANIERATKIKRHDPRVFQDGIYIVKKG